ncbi:MAG: glycoside hydrolase family 2 TIM barrel-domain containing protein [Rikenellaceae bacterium]
MRREKCLLWTLLLLCMVSTISASERVQYGINSVWEFSKDSQFAQSEIVSIPHTWNAEDTLDEVDGYYRGKGWYRRNINIAKSDDSQVYITFEGANQTLELFINGESVGIHRGGYTAFNFNITDYIINGENEFLLEVDNSHNPDIPPLSADFTFFGGVYRDVYITHLPEQHIFDEQYASSGVIVSQSIEDASRVELSIATKVVNAASDKATLYVESTVVDPCGESVAQVKEKYKAPAGTSTCNETVVIENPTLWSTETPNLYKVYTRLLDATGNELDCVVSAVGVRWYHFDLDKGFFLNGEPLKLMGTNRHQFFEGKGSALEDAMHVKDIKLLKEMGGNFLRVSHYPQDPVLMEMCDKLGILTSVEIPMVNAITMSQAHLDCGVEMAKEMVYQSYNSPSVIIWAYMNEIMLRPPYSSDDSIDPEEYGRYTYKIAKAIDDEIKTIDKERKTMFVCHGSIDIYKNAELTEIADILGWNLYNGWYSGSFDGFDEMLDKLKVTFPDKYLMVTEYGADVDPRLHCFDSAERFDFSSEYGVSYHKHYIKAIMERDFVAGAMIWNLNDFYSESRRDAVPYVNNKGITGVDRERKDSYYLYKAHLNPEPMVHIVNREWRIRSAATSITQSVEIYSNQPAVELFVNGQSCGEKQLENHTAMFETQFKQGDNTILAMAKDAQGNIVSDQVKVNYLLVPDKFESCPEPFTSMNVMMGSRRYFEDRENDVCWIPEQEYTPGSWGYVGGEPYRGKTRYGTLLGSSNDIMGSDNDPIFQTQRVGLEAFRADVEDGRYTIDLYISELLSTKAPEALAYNLGNDVIAEEFDSRSFDISINGTKQRSEIDIAKEYGGSRAVILRFTVAVTGGEGVNIEFTPKVSEPILNAIRIYKNY